MLFGLYKGTWDLEANSFTAALRNNPLSIVVHTVVVFKNHGNL